jgi:hypothetical protein
MVDASGRELIRLLNITNSVVRSSRQEYAERVAITKNSDAYYGVNDCSEESSTVGGNMEMKGFRCF